jgi:hypothetical protein
MTDSETEPRAPEKSDEEAEEQWEDESPAAQSNRATSPGGDPVNRPAPTD